MNSRLIVLSIQKDSLKLKVVTIKVPPKMKEKNLRDTINYRFSFTRKITFVNKMQDSLTLNTFFSGKFSKRRQHTIYNRSENFSI